MRRLGIIFCLVLLLASPGVALADVGQVHVVDDGWNSASYKAFTGGTSDHFQAACNFFSVDGYAQLNQSQRDYLMSNSTWISFYDAVTAGPYNDLEFQLFPGFNFPSYQLWAVDVDSQVYFDAKDLLKSVMSGTVSGTPDIPDLPTDVEVFDQYEYGLTTYTSGGGTTWTGLSGTVYSTSTALGGYPRVANGVVCYVPKRLFTDAVQEKLDSGWQFFVIVGPSGSRARDTSLYVVPDGVLTTGVDSSRSYYSIPYGTTMMRWPASSSYVDNDGDVHVTLSLANSSWQTFNWNLTSKQTFNPYIFIYHGSVDIPTEPDPNPDPPIQPPAPGTDVPTTDPPTWPTIQLPDIDVDLPSVDINWPTLAEGLDYTDLLRTIIARLESIGDILGTIDDDLSTHCQHLQRQIHEQAKYLGNLIVQGLHSDLSFLGTQIQSAYKSINQCIREQIGWLASQMQWVLNYDSDLDELEPWLQRIWNKIGKGSYYQPDPIDDEPGFLDWLEWIWEHVIGLLSEVTDGALDELLVVLDDLIHRFPFSIPWDVMALLALFAHTPEPIAFTITLPDVPGLYGGVIEVDCSGWDWMAGMVRPVLLVMFAYRLAMWTPKALESLGLLGEFKRSE